jgi:uncharacterized protein (DUF1330 family)
MPRAKTFGLAIAALSATGLALAFGLALPEKTSAAAAAPQRVFELRTYHTHPGRLDALNKRFREHTCRLFQKHGMDLIGFWTPREEKDGKSNTLVYLLAFPSREAADASWKAFRADPEWKTAQAASEQAAKIVEKVESVFLDPTDYSAIK